MQHTYPWPTPPSALLTQQIRQAGLQARTDIAGLNLQSRQSFAQLRNELTNDNFVSALGKYSVDDPSKNDRLALANLQENRNSRNDLSALHAARSCLYGSRQLGDRKWFSDKPGIARRLKSQNQRRQFRIGLIANLAFYNKLNLGDLESLMQAGDPSGIATISNATPLTVASLRQLAALASPFDILRVVAPDRALAVMDAIQKISDLSNYIQLVCGYLAANQAIEPAHAVICGLLRSGGNFGHAVKFSPIHVAAAAAAPLCHSPDVDGTLANNKTNPPSQAGTAQTRRQTRAPNRYPFCFRYNLGQCTTVNCQYVHACSYCSSRGHGRHACNAFANRRRPLAIRNN